MAKHPRAQSRTMNLSSSNSPHQRPQWFRVYHGHRVSTITLARREYRFGKHSGAATRGIRLWKKSRRDLNKPCNLVSQNSYLAPRFVHAFLEFPTREFFFSVPNTRLLFCSISSGILDDSDKKENVFTRNVRERNSI